MVSSADIIISPMLGNVLRSSSFVGSPVNNGGDQFVFGGNPTVNVMSQSPVRLVRNAQALCLKLKVLLTH